MHMKKNSPFQNENIPLSLVNWNRQPLENKSSRLPVNDQSQTVTSFPSFPLTFALIKLMERDMILSRLVENDHT